MMKAPCFGPSTSLRTAQHGASFFAPANLFNSKPVYISKT